MHFTFIEMALAPGRQGCNITWGSFVRKEETGGGTQKGVRLYLYAPLNDNIGINGPGDNSITDY